MLKRLSILILLSLSCNGAGNIDILRDQNGKGHFYNRNVLFNQDSTRLWCYTHEQFEIVKKDTNKTRYKDWNNLANDWKLY
jgi:hypothetical protein|tara:strand:- start:426 stop:668 length:243 start_codon:yes stop_codon:yes gene_type:complete